MRRNRLDHTCDGLDAVDPRLERHVVVVGRRRLARLHCALFKFLVDILIISTKLYAVGCLGVLSQGRLALFARVLLSSATLLSCPFSCCALVSLLLLCSCVPSPAVLCVHRPLRSLLNSHAPSSSARPLVLWVCTSSTGPTHYFTPSRSLWRTPHRSIDFSLCGLTGSFCRLPRPIAPTN